MHSTDFENFDRPPGPSVEDSTAEQIRHLVHENPFKFTLLDVATEFAVDTEAVRQSLRGGDEYLTAIPVQDGNRHVWGYSKEATSEWEYLRRRLGAVVSSVLSLSERMERVIAEYGPPANEWTADVAELLGDLWLTLPMPAPLNEEGTDA